MNSQKNANLFNKKVLYNDKIFQIFRFGSSTYSDCLSKYGDLNDKENIN